MDIQRKVYMARKAYSEAAAILLKKNLDDMAGCLDTDRTQAVAEKLSVCRNMNICLKDISRARAADAISRVREEKDGDVFVFFDFWYENRAPFALFAPKDNLYICCTGKLKKGRFNLNMNGLYNSKKRRSGQREPDFWLSKAKIFKDKYLAEKI